MQKTVLIINDNKIIVVGRHIQVSGFGWWQKHWILQAAFPNSDREQQGYWQPGGPPGCPAVQGEH